MSAFLRFLLTCAGVAAAQTVKEPVYKPAVFGKNADKRVASGTVSVAGKRLRFVASPQDENGEMSARSVLTVFTDTKPVRQVGRVLLPKNVPFRGRWDDATMHYLLPKRKNGVIVSVNGWDEWILITFPKGFAARLTHRFLAVRRPR